MKSRSGNILALVCILSNVGCTPYLANPSASQLGHDMASAGEQVDAQVTSLAAPVANGYLSALQEVKARQLAQRGASQFARGLLDVGALADMADKLSAVRAGTFVEATSSTGTAIAWSDSGNWPTPLATGTITGVLSGQAAGQEVERYQYKHEILALNASLDAVAAFRREEEVAKSMTRPLGRYVFISGVDSEQRPVMAVDFTPASGIVRRFGVVDFGPGGNYERVYSGETPDGASGSMTVVTQVDLASRSFKQVLSGKVRTGTGIDIPILLRVKGYADSAGTLVASASISLDLPTGQASSSFYASLNLDPDAPASGSSGNLMDLRPNINPLLEALFVPFSYVPERRVFRMGEVLELPAGPLFAAITRAKVRARTLGL